MGKFDAKEGVCAFVHQAHAAAMGLHIFLHDGQTDAGAAHGIVRLANTPVKGFKHAVTVHPVHAGALVKDVQTHMTGRLREHQPHRALGR